MAECRPPADDAAGPGLAQSRRRLDDLARLVSDWLWETDADFRLRMVSPRAFQILDLPPQALLGRVITDLGRFLAEDGTPIALDWRSAFRDVPFEAVVRGGARRFLLVSGLPVFDEATGAFVGVRGTARDVTENRRVAAALRESEERLALALEASSDAIWEWSPADGRIYFSVAWARMLGLEPRESRTTLDAWSGTLHPDDRDRVLAALRGSLGGDPPFEIAEYRTRTADGRTIWVLTRAKVVARDRAGRATRVVGTHRDISPRKAAEEALRVAKEDADFANRAKTEFLANMSHELRTPLNSIIGFSDILANETFGPLGRPEYRDYARDINDSGRHLLNLISDILDVSRIEANGLQLAESAFDAGRLTGSCLRLMRERAVKCGVELRRDLPTPAPVLYADERRVRQIILNLLSNAIKFTPGGGSVTIRMAITPSGDLDLSVADTGIGIAEQDLDLVMSPFRQADSSLARRYEGAGLGLPLSRRLAELHGGALTLSSTIGQGTVVRVRFPARRVNPPPQAATPSFEDPAHG